MRTQVHTVIVVHKGQVLSKGRIYLEGKQWWWERPNGKVDRFSRQASTHDITHFIARVYKVPAEAIRLTTEE